MQLNQQHKIVFVVNPASGNRQKEELKVLIENYFKDNPGDFCFFTLTGKNDVPSLTSFIGREHPHTIVAVGGDGTVSLVAKIILGTPVQLGILPAGSANGMARELGIPEDPLAALEIICSQNVKTADVIEINGHTCLHLGDIGLNARMIKYFEQGNIRGKIGYAKVALKVLWQRQMINVTIHCKNEVIHRKAFMVVLANASKYGTGVVINPKGDLYDGLFEVIIIRQLTIWELLRMWIYPKPFDPSKIELLQAESVEMKMTHRVHFQVDGEYLGKVKNVKARILARRLNILLPE